MSTLYWSPLIPAAGGTQSNTSDQRFALLEDRFATYRPSTGSEAIIPGERQLRVHNEPRLQICQGNGIPKDLTEYFNNLPTSVRDCVTAFSQSWVTIVDESNTKLLSQVPNDGYIPEGTGAMLVNSSSSSSSSSSTEADMGVALFRSDGIRERRRRKKHAKLPRNPSSRTDRYGNTPAHTQAPGGASPTPAPPSLGEVVSKLGSSVLVNDAAEHGIFDNKFLQETFSDTEYLAALAQLQPPSQIFAATQLLPAARSCNRASPRLRYPRLSPPLRLLVEAKQVSIEFGNNFEPYFCTLALFEISQKHVLRLTEDFHFDINPPSLMAGLNQSRVRITPDPRTQLTQCVFELVNPNPDVHLVLRINRVARGLDLPQEKLYGPYMKPKSKTKNLPKLEKEMLDAIQEDGFNLRQPLCWGAVPLTSDTGVLPIVKITDLHPIRGSVSDALLMDVLKEKDTKNRLLGDFSFTIVPLTAESFETLPGRCYNPTLPMEPFDGRPAQQLIKLLRGFGSWNTLTTPPDHYVNTLYLYPESVSLKPGCSVYIEMVLKSSEGESGAMMSFSSPSYSHLAHTAEYITPVSLKEKKPHFWEEVKIDVPALLTTRHHILLKFCTVGGGKKKDGSILGHAVIPLWRCVDAAKQQTIPSILPDGRYTVTVHTGSLVPSYLQNVANNYPMPAGQQTKSKAKVPTFTFRLRFISSVMTNDTKLSPFFESLQDDSSDNDSKGMAGWDFFLGKSLEDAVNGIRLIPNRLCAQFFPVLFNQLFRIMCTRAEETAKTTMPVIIDLVRQVSVALGTHFTDFLTVYVNHAFQNPASAKRPVFAEVLRHLVALIDQDHPSLRNFEHWWFFLEVIVKSLALYRVSSGASRKDLCTPEFYGDLFRLIHQLFAPRRIISSYYGRCSASISCPAFFANLLHLCDRGIITELIHQYLEKISPGQQNAHLAQLLSNRVAEPTLLSDSVGPNEPDDGALEHGVSSTDIRTRRPLTRFKSGSNLAGIEVTPGLAASSRATAPAPPPLSPRGEKGGLVPEGSVEDLSKLTDDDESCDVDFVLLNTKFDILTHLSEDPLFFSWNMPTLATLSEVTTLTQLTERFWDRYPLCGEIIETCRQSLEAETADKPANVGQLIRNSIFNFRNILNSHLVNERVHNNKPLNLELICGMYFPFVQLIVKGKNRLDPSSFAEWLRCFLFILGHCSPQLLVDYWQMETHNSLTNFLSLLKMSLQQFDTNRNSPVPDAVIVIVANVTKLFVETFREKLELDPFLMDSLFQVVVGMLKTEVPSRAMVGYLLLKRYLQYFPKVLFLNRNDYCLNLVFQVFCHLNAQSPRLRQLGASVFLLLLKSNYATEGGFGRLKVYAPVAISQLVGGKASTRDAENLQGSLQSIADRLENSLNSASPAAVDDIKDAISKMISLIQYTHTISQVTSADPDLTADLYSKIAKSYVNSPDTRVQWLENLANHHQSRGDHLEAAVCLIHYASLVVQFLETYGRRGSAQPSSSVPSLTTSSSFVAPSVATSAGGDPKAVPIDNSHFVLVAPNVYAEAGLPVLDLETNEQFQLGDVWSKTGLCELLKRAIQLVEQSTYQELSLELYSMLSLIYKSMRDYSALTWTIQAYQAAVTKLIQLNKGTRILARFYRVSFYGAKAGELNGREYIYKRGAASTLQLFTREMEDALLRLVESPEEVVRLDNRAIKVEELDPKKAYYQVAAVKPYTEKGTKSIFEQHFAINKFIFESVYEKTQKKKTIFSTEKFFPYSKTRLPIVSKEDIVLSPIESAIENLRERSDAVTAEMQSNPPNINRLQQIIQGSVVPTVNEGPLGICNDFLAADKVDQFDPNHILDLKENLSRLIKQCGFAIKLLARLITDESKPLQDVFEKKYEELKVTLRTFGVPC